MMMELQHQINGYVEVASPQLLDENWQEFVFDLASGQNVLDDSVNPEFSSGYVYRDANHLGSATHNRYIYWRTVNDILELVEVSTEMVLEDNQVRIKFVNSRVINNVNVIELSDCIVVMIATIASVHRIYLPHPKTTSKSVLSDLTSEVLFNPSNYYIINSHGPTASQHPIVACSWFERSQIKCALSFPDSSILIVQFGHQTYHITTTDIKQSGIIGRLWSKMPNLWAKSGNECENAIFASSALTIKGGDDTVLFTLCRDCRIRVFSTKTKECVCSYNMVPQASFHQSFAGHASLTCEAPMLKISESQIIIYHSEEFLILDYSCDDGVHELKETLKVAVPRWEQLIDFAVTRTKVWALAMNETDTALYYIHHKELGHEETADCTMTLDVTWNIVGIFEEPARPMVYEIFWSNRFSPETVRKALVGLAGPQVPKVNTMVELEEYASTRIFDGDQDKQWNKFFKYCLENHQTANKNIGLVAAADESIVSIIKRSNPSFVTTWTSGVGENGLSRGVDIPDSMDDLAKILDRISASLDDKMCCAFDQKLLDDPTNVMTHIDEIVQNINWKSWFQVLDSDIPASVDHICDILDLTEQAKEYNEVVLKEISTKMRSEHNPLSSNFGIAVTFELFRQLVRARMTLVRDMLLYAIMLQRFSETEKSDYRASEIFDELYTSGRLKRLLDLLRSYGVLVWVSESRIKTISQHANADVVDMLARNFEFFRSSSDNTNKNLSSTTDKALQQNLLMSFLANGGVNFSWSIDSISRSMSTLSSSDYASEIVNNLCKLLWPSSSHLSLPEYMLTQQLDDHLAKYLDMTDGWIYDGEQDKHFIRAANCILQNRASQGVEIFNRLWMNIAPDSIIGRFVGLDQDTNISNDNLTLEPDLIYRYYEKLIELFRAHNNRQCLVMLINHCMALIDEKSDCNQQDRVNRLRAKLFQYHLELDDSDEAYHTMVLTTDASLRFNCLRKFIVSHCEKEQWMNLLSYPYIEIKNDFIDILNQKAQSLDLSKLDEDGLYKTSYYDLLFASYISDDDYRSGAETMYSYAQRLAQEVPGITSIKKQSDCLLVSLNALRCVGDSEKYFDFKQSGYNEKVRITIPKRSHDGELDLATVLRSDDDPQDNYTRVFCRDIKLKYELTRARLRLLAMDQIGNAIALSPLTPEETVSHLIASSMFSVAFDLALLFGASMEPILEGLTAKYILIMRLTNVDISVHQEVDGWISDIFSDTYSIVDTYNYVASSTIPLDERIWHLIHYYLVNYDGVSHTYSTHEFDKTFSRSTILTRVVACKILSAGYDVPASLRRLYLSRNPAELLKLFIKYNKLVEAAELATEMIDRTLEPANCLRFPGAYASSRPPPLYLPSHLMLLLITYLNEDATNRKHLRLADSISEKLDRFRDFVEAN